MALVSSEMQNPGLILQIPTYRFYLHTDILYYKDFHNCVWKQKVFMESHWNVGKNKNKITNKYNKNKKKQFEFTAPLTTDYFIQLISFVLL